VLNGRWWLVSVSSRPDQVNRDLLNYEANFSVVPRSHSSTHRRFPGLRSFLKDGEVQQYKDVAVHYVRGAQAILHVYNRDGKEIYTLELQKLRSKEKMHAVLQEWFDLKGPDELARDQDQAERVRRHRSFQKFHRQEYVRLQHLHAQWFRREVMRQEEMSWVSKDWLCRNYDKINKGYAISRQDLLLYAKQYLLRHPTGVARASD